MSKTICILVIGMVLCSLAAVADNGDVDYVVNPQTSNGMVDVYRNGQSQTVHWTDVNTFTDYIVGSSGTIYSISDTRAGSNPGDPNIFVLGNPASTSDLTTEALSGDLTGTGTGAFGFGLNEPEEEPEKEDETGESVPQEPEAPLSVDVQQGPAGTQQQTYGGQSYYVVTGGTFQYGGSDYVHAYNSDGQEVWLRVQGQNVYPLTKDQYTQAKAKQTTTPQTTGGGSAGAAASSTTQAKGAGSSRSNPIKFTGDSMPSGATGLGTDTTTESGDRIYYNSQSKGTVYVQVPGQTAGQTTTLALKPGEGVSLDSETFPGESKPSFGYTRYETYRDGGSTNRRADRQVTPDGASLDYNYAGKSGKAATTVTTTNVKFPDGREMTITGSEISGIDDADLRSALEAARYLGIDNAADLRTLGAFTGVPGGGVDFQGDIDGGHYHGNSDGIIVTNDPTIDSVSGQSFNTETFYHNPMQSNRDGSRVEYDGDMSVRDGPGTINYDNSIAGFEGNSYRRDGKASSHIEGVDTNTKDDNPTADQVDFEQFTYGDNGNVDGMIIGSADAGDFSFGGNGEISSETLGDSGTDSNYFDRRSDGNFNLGTFTQDGSTYTYILDSSTGQTYYIDEKGVQRYVRPPDGNINPVDNPETEGVDESDETVSASDVRDQAGRANEWNMQNQPVGLGMSRFMGTSQFMNWIRGFTHNHYQGLSGFSSLFWDDDELEDFRQRMGEFMCDTVVLGNIDCWVATLCESTDYFDDLADAPSQGTAMVQIQGQWFSVAHIEGDRGLPMSWQNETGTHNLYPYKISYFVMDLEDPEEENLTYDLYLEYSGGEDHPVHWELDDGGSHGATGEAMIVFYSSRMYTSMRIEFDPPFEYLTSTSSLETISEIRNEFTSRGADGATFVDEVTGESTGTEDEPAGTDSDEEDESGNYMTWPTG